jgi:NADPH-dependent ferric siderophore reductase
MISRPHVVRVRHELKRRRLEVSRVENLPANMKRVVLTGEDLAGFTSLAFDDHVKLFFPTEEPAAMAARDFTPRRHDAAARELWIDFFLHDAGPAAAWAAQAAVGQALEVGGPKGSAIVALESIEPHVFIGDETALPAIQRRLEELPPGVRALVVVEMEAESSRPVLESPASVEAAWVARDARSAAPAEALIETLRRQAFPSEGCFVWVALESHAARAVRAYLRAERHIDKAWIKAAAYWKRGAVGVHERIEDES